MASYQSRIEDLIGSVGDTLLITNSLTDAAAEMISILPKECLWVVTANSGDQTSNGYTLESCVVMNVVRENGTGGEYESCKEVPMSFDRRAQDVNSMWFPSTSEPVFLIKNAKVYVYPTPGSDPNAFQVDYVANPAVAFDDTAITAFPNEYEYVVVIGASLKCLMRIMLDNMVNVTVALPASPGLPGISYSNASVGNAVGVAQDALTAAVDAITSAVDPYTGETDYAMTGSAAGVTDADAPTNAAGDTGSAYTAPTVEGASVTKGLLSMGDGTINTDADQIDYEKWWDILSEFIENEEDVEMANAQVSKIRTYIDAFQAEVQSATAAMQATIEDARQSTQASIANAANDVSTNNASIASLTQAAIATHQADTTIKGAGMSSLTGAKTAKMQQSTSASIAKMRESTGASIAKMQQSTSAAIQQMLQSTNINIQNAAQTMEASLQDYRLTLNRFTEELKEYSAEVSKQIQEQTLTFQQYTTLYDRLQSDYERGLKIINIRFVQYNQPVQAASA